MFLVLTLVVAHFAARAMGQPDELLTNKSGLASMVDNDAAAVGVRLVLFASFPLIFSVLLLLAKRRTLKRASLQPPFYAQCYPAAAFAAVLGVAAQISILKIGPDGLGGLVMLGCVLWLGTVEALWVRREQKLGRVAAVGLATIGMVVGIAITAGAALLLLR